MGNPLTNSQFTRLLDTRLREVWESRSKYNELAGMRSKLFRTLPSDSAWEEFYSVGAVPDIPAFSGKISYLPVYPGYHVRIEPGEYAGALQSERKFIDDKKYAVLDNKVEALRDAADRTMEKSAARVFANAFSAAFDFQTNEEGVSLCSSSHTTKSGTSTATGFDNSGTTALSKTSVAATRILMRQFRNDISERIEIGNNLAIICPDNLVEAAYEIVNTPKGLDTTSENQNFHYKRYEIIPYPRLDDYDSNNWFMVDLDLMKRDLVWIDRVKPEDAYTSDFETLLVKHSVYMRYGCGFLDWRFIYGHTVS